MDLWEQLVTQGHVRASRLRWAQVWMTSSATFLAVIGVYAFLLVSPSEKYVDSNFWDEIDALRSKVEGRIKALPKLELSPSALQEVPISYEVDEVFNLVLVALNQKGELPNQLKFKDVDENGFWSALWPTGELLVLNRGDIKAIGGIVFVPSLPFSRNEAPQIRRWVAIYRLFDEGWQGYFLDFPNGYYPSLALSAQADEIPLTLENLMPESD